MKKKTAEGLDFIKSGDEGANLGTQNSFFVKGNAKFFLRIISSVPLAMAVFNEQEEFMYVNTAFTSLFGYGFNELSQLGSWMECACPEREYRQAVMQLWKRSAMDLTSGKGITDNKREIRLYTRSKEEKFIEISFNSVFDFLIVVFEDITDKKNTENKLRRQIEFTNNIALTSPLGIITTDTEGNIVFVNRKAENILGLKRSKLIKLRYTIADWNITAIDGEKFFESEMPLSVICKTSKPVFNIRHAAELTSGKRVFLQVNASPILINESELLGMIVIFEDITESLKAESIMKADYNFRNAIITNAAEGLCVYHYCSVFPNLRFSVWNNQMRQITGYSLDEINKKGWFQSLFPGIEIRGKTSSEMQHMNLGADLQGEECVIVRKDKQKRKVTISTSVISRVKGNVYMMALVNDVTEKRKHEEEIKQKNQELKEAQRIGNIGSWYYSFDEDEFYWSDQIFRIFGYEPGEDSPQQILSRHIALISVQDFKSIIRELKQSERNDNPEVFDFQIENKLNERRYLLLRGEYVEDESGRKTGSKGTLQDITERKEQELELTALNNTKDRLFSIIAHDLKNPIGVLVGLSELLEEAIREKDYESIEKYNKIFSQSANKSFGLLVNLLDWARSQSNKIVYNPESVNLFEVVDEIRNLLSFQIIEKEIAIKSDINKSLLVIADINMLKSILRNLISNAIKYSHRGGTVCIKAEYFDQNTVRISISDNGMGIKDEHKNGIFNSETQISTHGTEKETGTGLGLLVCRDFVDKHCGKIWFESSYGEGSTFYFTLSKC